MTMDQRLDKKMCLLFTEIIFLISLQIESNFFSWKLFDIDTWLNVFIRMKNYSFQMHMYAKYTRRDFKHLIWMKDHEILLNLFYGVIFTLDEAYRIYVTFERFACILLVLTLYLTLRAFWCYVERLNIKLVHLCKS